MRHQRQSKNRSPFLLTYILGVILAFLIGSDVYMSNRLATVGTTLEQIEQQTNALEEDNQRLLADGVEQFSLNQLAIKAKELGFVEPEKVIDLDNLSETLALR